MAHWFDHKPSNKSSLPIKLSLTALSCLSSLPVALLQPWLFQTASLVLPTSLSPCLSLPGPYQHNRDGDVEDRSASYKPDSTFQLDSTHCSCHTYSCNVSWVQWLYWLLQCHLVYIYVYLAYNDLCKILLDSECIWMEENLIVYILKVHIFFPAPEIPFFCNKTSHFWSSCGNMLGMYFGEM